MRNVLLLISDLNYSFYARQLAAVATQLLSSNVRARIVVLGGEAPWIKLLHHLGVEIVSLGWTRPVQPGPLVALRRMLRAFRPHVIHTWDLAALQVLVATGGKGRARHIVSGGLFRAQLPG